MAKPRTCFVALFFFAAFCIAVGLEVKSFVLEMNTDSNPEFCWSSGTLGLSVSATHGDNWDDYVLQVDGRQFLRLTTDGTRRPISDATGNSIPLVHHAGVQTADTQDNVSVYRIGDWASATTLSPEAVRLASIFRPCGENHIRKNGLDGLATASLSQ